MLQWGRKEHCLHAQPFCSSFTQERALPASQQHSILLPWLLPGMLHFHLHLLLWGAISVPDDGNNTAKLHPGETQDTPGKYVPTPQNCHQFFQLHPSDNCFPHQWQNFLQTKPGTSAKAVRPVKVLQTLPGHLVSYQGKAPQDHNMTGRTTPAAERIRLDITGSAETAF